MRDEAAPGYAGQSEIIVDERWQAHDRANRYNIAQMQCCVESATDQG